MLGSSQEFGRERQEGNTPSTRKPTSQEDWKASLPDLLEVVGVTNRSHEKYQAELRQELDRVRACEEAILKRSFRQDVTTVANTLDDIIRNCDEDPNDIREALGLPSLVRRVGDSLEEYLANVSRPHLHASVIEQLDSIESMVADAVPWLENLLDQMRANDHVQAHVRARVLSRVFESDGRKG